jgi:hypothetical protein
MGPDIYCFVVPNEYSFENSHVAFEIASIAGKEILVILKFNRIILKSSNKWFFRYDNPFIIFHSWTHFFKALRIQI